MSEESATLARLETLLREGNDLRRQTLAMQQQSIDMQRQAFDLQNALVQEQKANLAKASQVNEQALAIQRKVRGVITLLVPVLIALIGYVSWLLFFKPYQ
jgi:multidrug efflux pump subunit AcrA (membrane-fusion protein)